MSGDPMAKLTMLKPRVATLDTSIAKQPPKVAAPIYGTPEYAEWRRVVIARAHGHCQSRGCIRSGVRLFADHIVELKDGGAPFDPRNGQALCGSCHTTKTARARAERHLTPGAGRKSGA